MDTNRLKSFAQRTRTELMGQVARRLETALGADSAERREAPAAMRALEARIALIGRGMVIEQVAYTWFNRFTALRYMDVNGYLTPMVVSPAPDRTRPELLDQAAAGALPDHLRAPIATRVRDLLEGRAPSREPQVEAYRLLLVATCNHLNGVMPFLFEEIADYTELLMPNELLAADGWVAQMRDVMTEDACRDVEVIGWLYQFYISEKKDQVFAGLKKNQKITAENIPAATQLFTPHWIVRYLVENSLGRLWLLNRPGSKLAERMEYYIAPEEPETDFLRITTPEEIRICDPACGSGHMLTYAFDLLYAIYEEEGFDPVQIPELILKNNLTGIEIDDRASALAAFALAMKAAAKLGRRRFLRMEVKPDVVVLENVEFTGQDRIGEFLRMIGQGSNIALADTLTQFGQAKNFGSLIVPKLKNPGEVLEAVRAKDFGGDIIWEGVRDRVVTVLRMAEALAPRYHVVVANPPYLDLGNMNPTLKSFVEEHYLDSKQGLDSTFIEVAKRRSLPLGYFTLITQRSWMFLSRLEAFRSRILSSHWLVDLIYLGPDVFPEINGEKVQNSAFVFINCYPSEHPSHFIDVSDLKGPEKAEGVKSGRKSYSLPAQECLGLPGSPLAFWASENLIHAFRADERVGDAADIRVGLDTGDNARFLRLWHEVAISRTLHNGSSQTDVVNAKARWVPHTKGGEYRKWFGNLTDVIAFSDRDYDALGKQGNKLPSRTHYFNEGVFYTRVSSGTASFRFSPKGAVFNSASPTAFITPERFNTVFGLLNSRVSEAMLRCLSPTLNFQAGEIRKLPISQLILEDSLSQIVGGAVALARSDWDAFETSWDFTTLPLLSRDHRSGTLEATYARLRAHWAGMTEEVQRLEEENNRIFIDAYGLQDELTPEIPIEEITLTCNPAYSFKSEKTDEGREARLLEQTMKELISYAIGCMFGRYSLDEPGLILANQGDTVQTYLDRIPEPTFAPDRDNVIPLFEEDWFEDDAYQRFREFLSLTFGPDRLVENLEFMRSALGKEVRAYLAKDFYADHVQRYKKRPIYWLVSSPKGAFQALIYMHRYTPDTLNITLNDYVRGLRDRLEAGMRAAKALEISPDASAAEKNRAKRDIDRFTKQIAEVTEWERDILYPLAVERLPIDLDDGVKRNYPKFPGVLKPIKGLEAKDA